ncbi:hypothetical protein K7432_014057, partial [Basidiobolus ranarum]
IPLSLAKLVNHCSGLKFKLVLKSCLYRSAFSERNFKLEGCIRYCILDYSVQIIDNTMADLIFHNMSRNTFPNFGSDNRNSKKNTRNFSLTRTDGSTDRRCLKRKNTDTSSACKLISLDLQNNPPLYSPTTQIAAKSIHLGANFNKEPPYIFEITTTSAPPAYLSENKRQTETFIKRFKSLAWLKRLWHFDK